MPHFPGRALVERFLRVILLPYTEGVSSTMLRRKLERRRVLDAESSPKEEWIRFGHEWIRATDEWMRYGDEWIRYAEHPRDE